MTAVSALSETFNLVLNCLNFDMIQYWKVTSLDGNLPSDLKDFKCQYSKITNSGKDILNNDHLISNHFLWEEYLEKNLEMCEGNLGQYLWLSSNENDLDFMINPKSQNSSPTDGVESDNSSNEIVAPDTEMPIVIPIKTFLIHRVKVLGEGNGYLVCYSFQHQLSYNPDKIDYVSAICDAAFLSTSASQSLQTINEDLDSKDFFFLDASDTETTPQLPLNQFSLTSKDFMDILLKTNSYEQQEQQAQAQALQEQSNKARIALQQQPKKDPNRRKSTNIPSNTSWSYTNRTLVNPPTSFLSSSSKNATQTYPIEELPILHDHAPDDLLISSFTDLKHLSYGLHSELLTGRYYGTKVFIKLMIPELVTSSLAQREFDFEQKLLRRVNHPNIVRILGSGIIPIPGKGSQRFTILEWLESGLVDMISTSTGKDKLIRKLIPSHKSIPFNSVVTIARDLANALDYLHTGVSYDVSIIHCQVEPENIRFDSNGIVKLIGFRASTCMRRRDSKSTRGYPVLEHTGTLRYTPPEVALRLSYSEKSDVYQFGIVLWQIARDKVPFLGLTKTEYLNRVVYANERPKVDKNWSPEFISLLQNCCHSDQFRRPSMSFVEDSLNHILSNSPTGKGGGMKKRLSWKLSNSHHRDGGGGDQHNRSEHGGHPGTGAAGSGGGSGGGSSKPSARRAIGESDRKSAWF
jgi:serine/threonine protein kinase